MARARNIKPSFFTNEDLVELPMEDRLLFIGLWTIADRRGRLEDRPKRIKMNVFPADEVDTNASLDRLQDAGVILRYEAGSRQYIQVLNFCKHQNPHKNEIDSSIPAPEGHGASTVQAPEQHGSAHADSLNPDSLNPDSLNPDSLNPEESPSGESSDPPGAEHPVAAKPEKWTEEDRQLAQSMLDEIRKVSPSTKGSKRWPDDVRLMRERDHRSLAEIWDLFTWANQDSFWAANILSPGKLREKWPQLEAQRNRPQRKLQAVDTGDAYAEAARRIAGGN